MAPEITPNNSILSYIAGLIMDLYIVVSVCMRIFKIGDLMCTLTDPHVGNLLVRQHPQHPERPQLVLLDHGLYRDMTDEFRRSYARLWAALLSANVHDIAKYCEELNVGHAYPLMASLLTFRSWDDITSNDLSRYLRLSACII